MASNDRIPSLKEALRETVDYEIPGSSAKKGKKGPTGPPPPPPGDWTTHPVTRTILWIILLVLVGLGIWKGPALVAYYTTHVFGFWLTVFIIAVVVILFSIAYWKQRTAGEVGWVSRVSEKKKKPE